MAKKVAKEKKLLAKLVTEERKPCAFCQREVDDEVTYGKLYAIGNIQCHYFCVLLSCCLIQKGKDEEGLFGFLYPDILAEIERSKKHRCSYCSREGATLGCSNSHCRKQFHLPCGRERNAVSLFFGNFKSYCVNHAPKQKVAEDVMEKARLRLQADRKKARSGQPAVQEPVESESLNEDAVCVICYEEVPCYPTPVTFWPPCCARDKWFHRSCLQRMALSAGMHYLKCPLCNDKETFYQAVLSQGYYVPDRDAAWELEQNAFAEIYERELTCSLQECLCPLGRDHDSDDGPWDIKLCLLCGSTCAHAQCLSACGRGPRYVCAACGPAAPADLDRLAEEVEKVVLASQASHTARGPVMPSRMSLRRTKQRMTYYRNSGSSSHHNLVEESKPEIPEVYPHECSSVTAASRQSLNLKPPRRLSMEPEAAILKGIENTLLSPVKLIEQGFKEKMKNMVGEAENIVIEPGVMERLRHRFREPRPLSEKRKILDGILEDLVSEVTKQKKPKTKDPLREWCSPKKDSADISKEIQAPEHLFTRDATTENKPEMITSPETEKITNTPIKTTSKNSSTPKTSVNATISTEDEDSGSTFELPSEFIAEDSNSPTFDTANKLKTVEIQKDSSMEISENNDVINIDLVKIENSTDVLIQFSNVKSPVKTERCAFKFSPRDKEELERNNIDIDLESFKNQYLTEVDRGFQCKFSHKHGHRTSTTTLKTAIDFAVEATERRRKSKKRREEKERRKTKKCKRMKVVYMWKSSPNSSPAKSDAHKTLKQYVLKYADSSSGGVIGKPERDVTPMKKKHFKNERSPDNLVQTSIQSFFKKSPTV